MNSDTIKQISFGLNIVSILFSTYSIIRISYVILSYNVLTTTHNYFYPIKKHSTKYYIMINKLFGWLSLLKFYIVFIFWLYFFWLYYIYTVFIFWLYYISNIISLFFLEVLTLITKSNTAKILGRQIFQIRSYFLRKERSSNSIIWLNFSFYW